MGAGRDERSAREQLFEPLLSGVCRERRAHRAGGRSSTRHDLGPAVRRHPPLFRGGDGPALHVGAEGARARGRRLSRAVRPLPDRPRHRPLVHGGRLGAAAQGDHPAAASRRRLRPQPLPVAPTTATAHRRHLVRHGRGLRRLHRPAARQRVWLPVLRPALPRPHAGRANGGEHHRRAGSHLCRPRGLRRRRHHPRRWLHGRPQQLRLLRLGRQLCAVPPTHHHRHRTRTRRHGGRPRGPYTTQDTDGRGRVSHRLYGDSAGRYQ